MELGNSFGEEKQRGQSSDRGKEEVVGEIEADGEWRLYLARSGRACDEGGVAASSGEKTES